MLGNETESPYPAPPGPTGGSNGHSTSVMFVIYMLIGFTVTLACIVVLTLLYFLIRCCLRRGGRTADCDPEGSESSLALPPREIYLVVHPGGATTVAYRDDEKLELKPRDKRAQCKRFVIELEARTPSSATSADFLIAASRPSARARPLSPPSANSRGMSSYPKAFSGHQILEQAAE
ncbi:g10122 [Coccomyxa viridis]|uniref:G10122 protein n=1 Tax=Coccomyxa viridis TaxID=1274662 RepID=A0ABP1G7A2_9CHLO